jgi:FMN reductase
MSGVVVVSGNPRTESHTAVLAGALGTRVAELLDAAPPEVIDLADFGQIRLVPDDPAVGAALDTVRDADLLVVATPAQKGSYTGVMKDFLDMLRTDGLAARPVLTMVTSAAAAQSEAADAALRTMLSELGAQPVGPGLTATETQLTDPAGTIDGYLDGVRDALHVSAR